MPDEYDYLVEELLSFGEQLGIPIGFWTPFFDLQDYSEISLVSDYYWDEEAQEWIEITGEIQIDLSEQKTRSGARWGCIGIPPFSKEWYTCQAFHWLRECYSGDPNNRIRAGFQLGKTVSEASWKERTETHLQVASKISNTRERAGKGGARTSRKRKLNNLEVLMQQVERLSDAVGLIDEDRILAQAFERARESEPNMPQSQKTLDSYGVALRSEEPFKSRYEAVFRKNA